MLEYRRKGDTMQAIDVPCRQPRLDVLLEREERPHRVLGRAWTGARQHPGSSDTGARAAHLESQRPHEVFHRSDLLEVHVEAHPHTAAVAERVGGVERRARQGDAVDAVHEADRHDIAPVRLEVADLGPDLEVKPVRLRVDGGDERLQTQGRDGKVIEVLDRGADEGTPGVVQAPLPRLEDKAVGCGATRETPLGPEPGQGSQQLDVAVDQSVVLQSGEAVLFRPGRGEAAHEAL